MRKQRILLGGATVSVLIILFQNCAQEQGDYVAQGIIEASMAKCRTPIVFSKPIDWTTNYMPQAKATSEKILGVDGSGAVFAKGTAFTLRKKEQAGCTGSAYQTWVTPREMSKEELETELSKDPCVEGASPSHRLSESVNPNDANFASQEHLTAIGAPQAWDKFWKTENLPPENIVVAVIDNGVEAHPDINLWKNLGETPDNNIDDDGNGLVDDVSGWNFENNNKIHWPLSSTNGEISHGTHVAGLAGAMADNSTGVAGVMGKKVSIMALNVVGNSTQGAADGSVAAAIQYAVKKGAHVINISLAGAKSSSPAIEYELRLAIRANVVVVVAAGNDARNLSLDSANPGHIIPAVFSAEFPGRMLTVGSIDAVSGAISAFSNYHDQIVNIAAPGSSSSSTGGLLSTATNSEGGYRRLQGTSMSSPIVAGATALVLGLTRARGYRLSPAEVVYLIHQSSDKVPALVPKFANGAKLNLAALAAITDTYFPPGGPGLDHPPCIQLRSN